MKLINKYISLSIVALMLILFVAFRYITYYDGEVSDHFDGVEFHNNPKTEVKTFADLLNWNLTRKRAEWPDKIPVTSFDMPPAVYNEEGMRVSYIGHATFLIQINGLNIITDPVYSEYASPMQFIGPRRVKEPGIKFKDLPKIDIILITHNHYDHMDAHTLNKLWARDKPSIILPLGNDVLINRFVNKNIKSHALDWFQEHIVNNDTKITLWQAKHWSSRIMLDTNKALWGGFVLTSKNYSIYFSGDTGYQSDIFTKLKDRFGVIDLAILPIGAYEPRWFMKDDHMNPEEAVNAFVDMGHPAKFIPFHYGIFELSDEEYNQPLVDLKKSIEALCNLYSDNLDILDVGQYFEFKK